MKLRPITGEVLIEILPANRVSAGGIEIPDHTASAEERQAAAHHPKPPPPVTGIVHTVGPWPKTRKGLAMLPEFKTGDRVLVGHNAGITMARNIGENYRMIRYDQVLAVFEPESMTGDDWDKFEKDAMGSRKICQYCC